MTWLERRLERLRAVEPFVVDAIAAVLFALLGAVMSYSQDIRDDAGVIQHGFRAPAPWLLLTVLLTCTPVAFRRRWPLASLAVSSAGILVHILIGWPEGGLPVTVLFLTYSLAAYRSPRQSVAGLAVTIVTLIVLGIADSPGLDTVGVVGVSAQFVAAWAVGVAMRNRRAATDARVSEAEERAERARQQAARLLAEERLRIAQELHDVVAHSMSVIAVQAGVGAHVLHDRPEQARVALDAISATSRGTLTQLRRLLGVLRDGDGERCHAPAPSLVDLPQLVADVRAAGVPVTLRVDGSSDSVHPGVELSAYRVVQEALTNVIKHAGATTRVEVSVRHLPDALAVSIDDDGRGMTTWHAHGADSDPAAGHGPTGGGHGLIGMRERVELWGGELSVGAAPGGGCRVAALLPYGDGA